MCSKAAHGSATSNYQLGRILPNVLELHKAWPGEKIARRATLGEMAFSLEIGVGFGSLLGSMRELNMHHLQGHGSYV